MTKTLFSIRIAMLLSLLSIVGWSCSDDFEIQEDFIEKKDHITLNITAGSPDTRAEQLAGEDAFNENLIRTVDLFFFPANADPTVKSVYYAHINGLNAKVQTVVAAKLPLDKVSDLFGIAGNNPCEVYAVVNCAEAHSLNTPTKGELDALQTGVKNAEAEGFNTAGAPADFVMYSGPGQTISYNKTNNSATGTINVKRVAAKIRLAANVQSSLYQSPDGKILYPDTDESQEQFEARMEKEVEKGTIKKWTPQLSNMRTYIVNGVNNARLDGKYSDSDGSDLLNPVYYYSGDIRNDAHNRRLLDPKQDYGVNKPSGLPASPVEGDTEFTYYNWTPIYTYPNQWENTEEEEGRTYLIVMVPWSDSDNVNANYQNTYYQVPLTRMTDENTVFSNHYYRIRLNIGVIGSFKIQEPVELDASYDIHPWGQETIGVDINEYRYLVVNDKVWEVDGEENVTIPFYSSHDVKVVNVKFTYYNFNDTWNGRTYMGEVHERSFGETENEATKLTPGNDGDGVYDYIIDNDARTLTFIHPFFDWDEYDSSGSRILNTAANADPAFFRKNGDIPICKFDIEITIRHYDMGDGTPYEETIYIHQKPSIYIDPERNLSAAGTNQYLCVNGNRTVVERNGFNEWDGVIAIGEFSGVNNNPNMYTIYVTQLSPGDDEKYNIGDPRSLDYNRNLSNGSFLKPEDRGYVNPHSIWGRATFTRFLLTDLFNYDKRSSFIWAYSYTRRLIGNSGWTAIYSYTYDFVDSRYETSKPRNEGTDHTDQNYVNNKNNLVYYYPADETPAGEPGSKASFIAPAFRIASSFGKTTEMDKESARRRCASYQEAGYPAGRWRLPTKAEIEYVVALSAKKRIPHLFGVADRLSVYWSSTGAVTVVIDPEGNVTEIRDAINSDDPYGGQNRDYVKGWYSVRCIYDDWYWVKPDGTPDRLSPTSTTFTWGDKEKQNPQETQNLLRKARKKK